MARHGPQGSGQAGIPPGLGDPRENDAVIPMVAPAPGSDLGGTPEASFWQQLGWQPDAGQLAQLQELQALLRHWNQRLNLTRLVEGDDYWIAQVFDSLWPLVPRLQGAGSADSYLQGRPIQSRDLPGPDRQGSPAPTSRLPAGAEPTPAEPIQAEPSEMVPSKTVPSETVPNGSKARLSAIALPAEPCATGPNTPRGTASAPLEAASAPLGAASAPPATANASAISAASQSPATSQDPGPAPQGDAAPAGRGQPALKPDQPHPDLLQAPANPPPAGTGLRVIDVGTGGGFPGLAVAIALPGAHITLVDSVQRKLEAVAAMATALGLADRISLRSERVERTGRQKDCRGRFQLALARAVAAAPVVAEYLVPLLAPEGQALLYRGQWNASDQAELQRALVPLRAEITGQIERQLPNGRGQRTVLTVQPLAPCPATYPRPVGVPAKTPLGTLMEAPSSRDQPGAAAVTPRRP